MSKSTVDSGPTAEDENPDECPTGYRIAAAEVADVASLERLPAIEIAASELFPVEDIPAELRGGALSVATFTEAARAGRLWIAFSLESNTAVGFVLATMVDDSPHVYEIDVHPDHGRHGIGAALMQAVEQWARTSGYRSVTLTTFRHLPWNAPFYRRLGFEVIPTASLTPALAALLDDEISRGLSRETRVAMRLSLRKP